LSRLEDFVYRALKEIPLLEDTQRREISALGLPVYESLVLGHLRAAGELLARDNLLTIDLRKEAWDRWLDDLRNALTGAMRYRENEPLLITVGICAVLYPALHPRAMLVGFKTLDDAAALAEYELNPRRKREGARGWLRFQDVLRRTSAWLRPDGRLLPAADLSPADQRALCENGCREVGAILLRYKHAERVTEIAKSILPLVTLTTHDGLLLAAARG